MLKRNNIILHSVSLCILCIGFLLCRYALFSIHGMKQFPVLLLALGVVFLVASFLIEGKIVPTIISLAYIIGFIAGVIFQSNGVDAGGGATNNLWMIWTFSFIGITFAGFICEKGRSLF